MKRIALCFLLIMAAVAPPGFAFAQRSRGTTSVTTSDAVVDGLKFHRISATSGFIQVTDIATGQSAGTIILSPKSPVPTFAIMPGYEDKVRAAYKKYSEGTPESASPTGGGVDHATRPSAGLTVDGVEGMLKAGISEDIIIEKIHRSGQTFDLSADDMIRLKNAKASNALIKAMMESGPASAGGAIQPAGSSRQPASPVVQPAPAAAPVTAQQGHGILQPGELEQMNNGTVRFDLNAMRVTPNLLQQKPVMQYFIALNNCNDSAVERALQNELDYPALASFYSGKAAEILAGLPDTAGIVMFGGDKITPGTGAQSYVLWGRRAAGNAPIPKMLTLGEYDLGRKIFPVLVSDKSKTIDVAGTQQVEANRGSLKTSCPVGYNTLMRSGAGSVLPTAYSVSVPSMIFSEVPMGEGDARKYIEGAGSGQRNIVLGVDLHLKPGAMSSAAKEFAYDGTIARVTVFNRASFQPVGTLYDDQSLPPIRTKTIPSAITTMKSTREFNEELITAVYVSQAADACGWPISPEQKANLKRYISDVNTYGKFNDRSSINGAMASVRNGINDPSRHFCENATERQDFDRRAATVWPRGPMAAPAN